jgi:hypothetical protein
MKLELKRPRQVYLTHGLWVVATVFFATQNSSNVGRLTLVVMACVGAASLISMLMRKNYFEVKNNTLIIHNDFFRTKSIELDKIEKVKIEPGPFTLSKIILKDNTQIKYHDSQVDDKELREFMAQFSIQVE